MKATQIKLKSSVANCLSFLLLLLATLFCQSAFCAEIHDAVKSGDLAKVKALLKDNPDWVLSKDNDYGWTPLHWAAVTGHKDITELLLVNKADVNAKGNNGETPLHMACYHDHKDVAELLLANKAKVNAKGTDGTTPLHDAAVFGNIDVVELLLANKADVDAKDNKGVAPLHDAAAAGYKDVVELLLASKADVNEKQKSGATPMDVAAQNAQKDIVDLLRQHRGHLARVASGQIADEPPASWEPSWAGRDLPWVGAKSWFPTVLAIGTITVRNVKTASCLVEETNWGATLHFRRLFCAGIESPVDLVISYIRVTKPSPSLFGVTLGSGLTLFDEKSAVNGRAPAVSWPFSSGHSQALVDGKSVTELTTKPLLLLPSFKVDIDGTQQDRPLFILASASTAPEDSMQAIYFSEDVNIQALTDQTECFVQRVSWKKQDQYSTTLHQQEWKRITWRKVNANGNE